MFEESYNKLLTKTDCVKIRFGQPPYIVHVELILTHLKSTMGHVDPAPPFTSRAVFNYNTANNPNHATSNGRITDECKGISRGVAVAQTKYHIAGLHKSAKDLEATSRI